MSDESINNYPKQLAGVSTPLPFGDAASSTRTDVSMALKALKQRWPISEDKREKIIEWLMDVAEKSDDSRARVNAGKALIEADKLNMEEEKRAAGGDILNVSLNGGNPIQVEHEHKPTSVFARILALQTKSEQIASDSAGDGIRESLDTRHSERRVDDQAG